MVERTTFTNIGGRLSVFGGPGRWWKEQHSPTLVAGCQCLVVQGSGGKNNIHQHWWQAVSVWWSRAVVERTTFTNIGGRLSVFGGPGRWWKEQHSPTLVAGCQCLVVQGGGGKNNIHQHWWQAVSVWWSRAVVERTTFTNIGGRLSVFGGPGRWWKEQHSPTLVAGCQCLVVQGGGGKNNIHQHWWQAVSVWWSRAVVERTTFTNIGGRLSVFGGPGRWWKEQHSPTLVAGCQCLVVQGGGGKNNIHQHWWQAVSVWWSRAVVERTTFTNIGGRLSVFGGPGQWWKEQHSPTLVAGCQCLVVQGGGGKNNIHQHWWQAVSVWWSRAVVERTTFTNIGGRLSVFGGPGRWWKEQHSPTLVAGCQCLVVQGGGGKNNIHQHWWQAVSVWWSRAVVERTTFTNIGGRLSVFGGPGRWWKEQHSPTLVAGCQCLVVQGGGGKNNIHQHWWQAVSV